MDDYVTLDMGPARASVLQSCEATTHYLYSKQKRYQPVRLCVFAAFTRYFKEENSVYYNFALHLINILLLFLLLRKFKVGSIFSLISVLLFAVFGRFRYMDSTSVMVGGSGLNLLFILTTFLFLIKGLQATAQELLKRYAFLTVSALAYAGLVFSYEVAIPLFAPLVMVFYLFNPGGKGLLTPLKTKKMLYLLLYLVPLLFYIVFYRLLVKVSYEGAEIVWSLDIFIRLKSYILYTLIPSFKLYIPSKTGLLALGLYFAAVIVALKSSKSKISPYDRKKSGLNFLLFGATFYSSAIVIFTLNDWSTPADVMVHHTYLLTAAGATLIASLFYNFQWIFPDSFRKIYLTVLIVLIFPIILLGGVFNAEVNYGTNSVRASKASSISRLKKGIQSDIQDIDKTDAILLKNLYAPFYEIKSMNGAFEKWFGFQKDIMSGREIISARGDDIVFKGPLSIYAKARKFRVRNDRARIFFMSPLSGEILPYHYFVDFVRRLNIYQTLHVKEDFPSDNYDDQYRLEAILSNFKKNNYLNIWFKSNKGLQDFAKSHTLIEVNDELVPDDRMILSGDRLSIDISGRTKKINYFFLKVLSSDDRFKSTIRLIALTRSLP